MDTAPNGYELLALSFDGTKPRFAPHAKKQQIENKELTVFYDMQCPYILQRVERVERYCGANGVPLSLVRVDTLQKAKELPCVFNNWAVFYKGKFETVNLLDDAALQRLLKNEAGYPKGVPGLLYARSWSRRSAAKTEPALWRKPASRRRAGAESPVCAREALACFFRCIPINRDLVSGSLYNAIVNTTFSKPCILAASARQFLIIHFRTTGIFRQ